jgi:hypothetical protein
MSDQYEKARTSARPEGGQRVAETVFILGAGASREAGGPLMRDFFDVMERVIEGSQDQTLKDALHAVIRAVVELETSAARIKVDTNNVESVLGLFEMTRLVGVPVAEGHDDMVDMLDRLIAETIERTVLFDSSSESRLVPHASYMALANLVKDIQQRNAQRCAVITLNYDCALELALAECGVPYQYSLPSEAPTDGAVPVLKLHGSLNWGHCGTDGSLTHAVVPYRVETFLQNVPFRPGTQHVSLAISRRLDKLSCPECQEQCSKTPVIVPPSWNKTSVGDALRPVWRRAATELGDARNIYVIGYSIPQTDLFFRDLLAIGLKGGSRIERFWVYDPAEEVRNRYRTAIAGPVLQGNGCLRTEAMTFTEAVADLKQRLDADFDARDLGQKRFGY